MQIAKMDSFDNSFFNALAEISAYALYGSADGFIELPVHDNELTISALCTAAMMDDAFINLAHKFVTTLSTRSTGRYLFEEDFRVRPWQVFTYNKGAKGRKQLHIRFDALPPNRIISWPWGASIGLGFDLRGKNGINAECVNDYEAFSTNLFCEPELFDATFGSLGSYAEPDEDIVTAEQAWQAVPGILDHWLFFGRRISSDSIAAYGSLDGFVDECIRVFDVICEAGYYDPAK